MFAASAYVNQVINKFQLFSSGYVKFIDLSEEQLVAILFRGQGLQLETSISTGIKINRKTTPRNKDEQRKYPQEQR